MAEEASSPAPEKKKAPAPKSVKYKHAQNGRTYDIVRRYKDHKGGRWIVVEEIHHYTDRAGRPQSHTIKRHIADPVQPKRKTITVELPLEGEEEE